MAPTGAARARPDARPGVTAARAGRRRARRGPGRARRHHVRAARAGRPSAVATARVVAAAPGCWRGGRRPRRSAPDRHLGAVARRRRRPPGRRDGRGARSRGPARAVLTAERTLLNLLCHLSGVATLTAAYVEACAPVAVLDTRKTTPGMRALEKAAVVAGGGAEPPDGPVRPGAGEGQPPRARRARPGRRGRAGRGASCPDVLVEVEADDLDGRPARPRRRRRLDPARQHDARTSCARRSPLVGGRAKLEASGGMTLEGARAAAATGVDAVSVGALTHSAPALDLGLDID